MSNNLKPFSLGISTGIFLFNERNVSGLESVNTTSVFIYVGSLNLEPLSIFI